MLFRSITVNFPTGYQVGDAIYVATTQSDTTTVSVPSTYTLVTNATSGGTSPKAATDVSRHAIASGESSVTITYSGTTSVKAVVLADYRGVDTTLPVDVYSSASTAGGTTVAAPSVSPRYANDRLLVFQGARGTFPSKSWTAPTGMSEQIQVNSQANVSTGLADLALTSAGATGSKTSTFSASANLTTIILAIPQPPSVLFYQTDQLGSTRMLTDSAGAVRGTFSYDAYGNLIGSTGSYSTPLSWTGQYRDAESGLEYLQTRYYDPATAQFLARDGMVTMTRTPYQYVADNPLNATDPSGACGLWGSDTCLGDAASAVVSTVSNNWSFVAQAATVAAVGIGTAACIAATDGLCALALPFIGAATGTALYAESTGPHTAEGYAMSFAEGGIGGSIALACMAACAVVGSLALGGALVNGLWGAGQGAWDYGNNGSCDHTPWGYAGASAGGLAQGAIPWDQIWKFIRPE